MVSTIHVLNLQFSEIDITPIRNKSKITPRVIKLPNYWTWSLERVAYSKIHKDKLKYSLSHLVSIKFDKKVVNQLWASLEFS